MTANATLPVLLGTGIHSARPAAGDVGSGGLYSCTTHSLVYQTDGSSWTTWATLGGTAATESHAYLTGNVDLTGANTYVDVVSLSLSAGTYLLIATVLLQGVGSGGCALTAKLWDGTNVEQTTEAFDTVTGGSFMELTLTGWITLVGTVTWKVSAASSTNHGTALATAAHSGTTNKATVLRAIKIA